MRTSRIAVDTLVVLVIATIGLLLALQGWKSQTPTFDLVPYIDGAHELLVNGRLPDRGTLTSFGSYTSPGTAWLLTPGVFFFNDLRLFQSLGSAVIYLGSLIGIFLLGRTCFGAACARLSVALYGLSHLGLYVGGLVWPRFPIQFFYIWMAYWTVRWVTKSSAKYLAAAVVTWAAGVYVFMEIAPALFVLPVVSLLYRRPIWRWPLFAAGAVALTIWYPYLIFESERGFIDLRSQMFLEFLVPANYKISWCDSNLHIRVFGDITTNEGVRAATDNNPITLITLGQLIVARANASLRGLLSNFTLVAPVPGVSVALLLLVSIMMLSVTHINILRHMWSCWLKILGTTMIVYCALANELLIARYFSPDGILAASTIQIIRGLQLLSLLGGIGCLTLRPLGQTVTGLRIFTGVKSLTPTCSAAAGPLMLSLTVPWLILLLIAEPGRLDRLWWLWPLQVICLAASVTDLPFRLRAPRAVSWIGAVLLLFVVSANTVLLSRINSWLREGWSGFDAEEILVVDYVANQIQLDGKDRGSIGYRIFNHEFMATFNVIDSRYKVGADWDLLFKYRHRISNTNGCAEGISANDEYRIVQMTPKSNPYAPKTYFDAPLDESFQMLRQFSTYRVFKRA